MDWELFWAWTADEAVWDWIRTVSAGLVGALIGGLFTLLGQYLSGKNQLKQQREQFALQARADAERWERERFAAARAMSIETSRTLLKKFSDLHTAVRDAPIAKQQMVHGLGWDAWDVIWDADRSGELELLAGLIVDEPTRSVTRRLISVLNRAEVLTAGYNLERVKPHLKELALSLASDGVEIVSSYIRDSEPPHERRKSLEALEAAYAAYEEYEEWSLQRQLERYESMASSRDD